MELKYLVREPENITSKTNILFLLHGYGSNEEDLFSFVPTLPKDWIVVSFRAPNTTEYGGFSWFEIDLMKESDRININQAKEAVKTVLENILSVTNRYGLTQNETHICGFSQGGILSYTLALENPELFSKIACMSCYPEEKLLTDINTNKKKLEKLRFFVSHGTDDAVIPLDWAQKGAEMLYDLGCYFTFREYMSGHGVNQKNYMDLMDFFES